MTNTNRKHAVREQAIPIRSLASMNMSTSSRSTYADAACQRMHGNHQSDLKYNR